MTSGIVDLAYRGEWSELLRHLERQPELVNSVSEKGYTPLHQAAWHGANRQVIGTLLALGADTAARTFNRGQTPADIALDKHPAKEDLHFLLHAGGRSPAQLLRKVLADRPGLFKAYDGNRVMFDRVVECLNSGDRERVEPDAGKALLAGIRSVAGAAFFEMESVDICESPMDMLASSPIWLDTILPAMVDMSSRARAIPLEPSYAVMADLFNPIPSQWGLRGDPFLWMEMAHALCHVPIPTDDSAVERVLLACFTALTGAELKREQDLSIERFARGGMSSGMINGESWTMSLMPTLRHRARWLRDAWSSRG
jgi:hypothetical protein